MATDAYFGLYTDEELQNFAAYKRIEGEEGKHLDQGKLRYDLVPLDALTPEVEVWTYGVRKYGESNWTKGIRWSRLFASTLRHLYKWWRGVDLDEESGLPHLAHARCCLGMLMGLAARKELDDRPKPN